MQTRVTLLPSIRQMKSVLDTASFLDCSQL